MARAKFFSVFSGGSTDSLLIENKIIYRMYFDSCPIGSDSVEVHSQKNELLGILSASNGLVGFTSGGACIN